MYCEFLRKNIVRDGYNGINKNSNNLDNRIIGLLFLYFLCCGKYRRISSAENIGMLRNVFKKYLYWCCCTIRIGL